MVFQAGLGQSRIEDVWPHVPLDFWTCSHHRSIAAAKENAKSGNELTGCAGKTAAIFIYRRSKQSPPRAPRAQKPPRLLPFLSDSIRTSNLILLFAKFISI